MQRIIYTVLAAFVMALALGPIFIPWLKRMKFGQTINELGPQSHKVKQGIPTMGGMIFALPALVAGVIFAPPQADWQIVAMPLVCMVGFGLIGFVDDFIKKSVPWGSRPSRSSCRRSFWRLAWAFGRICIRWWVPAWWCRFSAWNGTWAGATFP